MYDELALLLRMAANRPCSDLDCPGSVGCGAEGCLFFRAAEAIEKLALNQSKTTNSEFKANWISVKERLPEDKGHVLVTDGKFVGEAAFFPETKYHMNYFPAVFCDPVEEYENYRCTHWMPLPTPPKEEQT